MKKTPTCIIDRNALVDDFEFHISTHQSAEKRFAVLLININHFRQINITYGYQAANDLLEKFFNRLKSLSREQDYIARIGNAEFIMLLPDILNAGHVTLAAHKLLGSLAEPFQLGEHKIKVTADMGIALFPEHATNVQGIIQKAEIALIDARNTIKSYAIYSENSHQAELYTWDIEIELQNAQEQDEFEMYFQPQVSLKSGAVYGAEALIRWKHPQRGFIRPDIFIPIAEHSGQIHKITWWTLNATLRLLKDWPINTIPLKVAINLSTKVLKDAELVSSIKSAINIWGTDYPQLTLEVTESALMEDMNTSFTVLDELSSLGLNISIDDFGTGYSSMAYFKNIPANELKIDQSFISHMLENPMDQHIVKTLIEMAHGFELKVVAEGVENLQTYEALKKLGCDIAQGYYLARPMPQDDFLQWIKEYQAAQAD